MAPLPKLWHHRACVANIVWLRVTRKNDSCRLPPTSYAAARLGICCYLLFAFVLAVILILAPFPAIPCPSPCLSLWLSGSHRHIIVLDDNMHLRSMRKAVCQLARKRRSLYIIPFGSSPVIVADLCRRQLMKSPLPLFIVDRQYRILHRFS